MIGILTFSKGILCQKDALGTSYNAIIGGLNVNITFPHLNNDDKGDQLNRVGLLNPLLPPEKAKKYKRGDEYLLWGEPLSAPEFDSVVNMATIECECSENDSFETAQKIYANVGMWENAFYRYCFLCTKQYRAVKSSSEPQGSFLDILTNGKRIPNNQPLKLTVHLHSHDDFASKETIINAMDFASSGKDLLLEYQMLLSAYNAIQADERRQAIIDGSSSVELCLIKAIEKYCDEKNMDPDILLKKYRSLGERFALVEKIDNTLPKYDYKNLIVKPRNAVSHAREAKPSSETVRKFINAVEEVLKHYHTTYY